MIHAECLRAATVMSLSNLYLLSAVLCSQGELAVASYGKKGNIKLLHDFDQPFTGDAGAKMISSLTLKQENTVTDQPVVDLLKYLNKMMNTNVANARLPSGKSPLRQLVLTIADGRLHEQFISKLHGAGAGSRAGAGALIRLLPWTLAAYQEAKLLHLWKHFRP